MTPDSDSSRFEACFEENYSRVLAFAMRRVEDRASAEDVVAETFAVAWRRRERIPELPLLWLYRVAARVIANQRRSTRRRLRLGRRVAAEPVRWGRDPADVVGEREAALSALSRLSDAQREVLMLVAWEELSAVEAAEVLACSAAAFRVRLHRARRELAKQLDAAGHFPVEQVIARPGCEAAQETK